MVVWFGLGEVWGVLVGMEQDNPKPGVPTASLLPPPLQVGPRDVEQGGCVVARRDMPGKEGKQFGVPMEAGAFVAHMQVRHPCGRGGVSNAAAWRNWCVLHRGEPCHSPAKQAAPCSSPLSPLLLPHPHSPPAACRACWMRYRPACCGRRVSSGTPTLWMSPRTKSCRRRWQKVRSGGRVAVGVGSLPRASLAGGASFLGGLLTTVLVPSSPATPYNPLVLLLPPLAGKWARGPWAGSDDDERRVKEETSATLRCFPFDQPQHSGVCFLTGAPAKEVALFAKAY